MALHESDREDIMAEATALVERAELIVPGWQDHVVLGFRRNGCLSLFFSPERVYQFNTRQELRRAYLDGLLYKAEHGRLATLKRHRAAGQVQLLRHDLNDAETQQFLNQAEADLTRLAEALASGTCQLKAQFPAEAKVLARVLEWLQQRHRSIELARSPRVL